MVAVQPSLVSVAAEQYDSLLQRVRQAEDCSVLEGVLESIELVAPLWNMLGRSWQAAQLRQAIRQRAGQLLLDEKDVLPTVNRYGGLYDSSQRSIRRLGELVSAN